MTPVLELQALFLAAIILVIATMSSCHLLAQAHPHKVVHLTSVPHLTASFHDYCGTTPFDGRLCLPVDHRM